MGHALVDCERNFRVLKFKPFKYSPPESEETFLVSEALLIDDQRLMLIADGVECYTIYKDTLNQLTDIAALRILEGLMI